MAIIFDALLTDGWMSVWRITEDIEQLKTLVTTGDISLCASINSDERLAQRLAWLAILRQKVYEGGEVEYNEVGAPFLPSHPDIYLGVSHCKGYAALICRHNRCAIDIERVERVYKAAVASRYISDFEFKLPCSSTLPIEAVIWCSKETLYKLSGLRELNLKHDISILSIEWCGSDNAFILGSILNGTPIVLNLAVIDGIIVVTA